ncbi:hypothetical protein KAR91_35735 [Candidatus Pacearchaeota archaeon]|nr:hypothetical protein [Candidatus Pacearchaeota archaeon]
MSSYVSLGIDLQSGFSDDTVTLEINGKEIHRIEHVQTRGPLGFAHSFTSTLETGMISVRVNVITRNLDLSLDFHISNDMYLGFSIMDGFIHHIFSTVPFAYA